MDDNNTAHFIFYVQLTQVQPSQHRYAKANVNEKINYALRNKDVWLNDHHDYIGKYDQGRSIYDLKDAFPVIKVKDTYVLIDGHHSALASLILKCQTIPVKIIREWPNPLDDIFWRWAESQDLAYLKKRDGSISYKLPSLATMEDDPLRYFVAQSARKFDNSLNYETSFGAEYPLWIKIGKDLPFIEWIITDHLHILGFTYQNGDEASGLQPLIEKARALLSQYPLPFVKIITSKERFDVNKQIANWLHSAPMSRS